MSELQLPQGFTKIPISLPPNLLKLMRYPGQARCLAIFYAGGKSTWLDGIASSTFSYYSVYQPFIEHPAVAIHLLDQDLGSDDYPATHALLIDREAGEVFVGEFNQAIALVCLQPDEPSVKET